MKFYECKDILGDNHVTIFLLHGVIEKSNTVIRNYNRKHILSDEFEYLLKDLTNTGTAISINDLIQNNSGKMLPKKAFIITFDDGFENNLSIAAPILKKYAVPAVFYITTSFIAKNAMSWIDRIDYAFELTANRPCIDVAVPWSSVPIKLESKTSRVEFLEIVRSHVKNERGINEHQLASSIQKQLGLKLTFSGNSQLDLKLDWTGVKMLDESDLFSIGGHSDTHSVLTFLSSDELNYEVRSCLQKLEKFAGINTTHFSYPEGLKHCYNEDVIIALKNHGIECCLTAEFGINRLDSMMDLFRLKRIPIT
jgi:peptidoglycan/xylan/chitin deacetylase (PgdA/CDA1 family)